MTRMSPEALAQLAGLLGDLCNDERLDTVARNGAAAIVEMRRIVARVEARGNRGACGRDGCPCVTLSAVGSNYQANIYEHGEPTSAPRCQGTVQSLYGRQCSRTAIVDPFYEHGTPGNRLVHYCQQHASKLAPTGA